MYYFLTFQHFHWSGCYFLIRKHIYWSFYCLGCCFSNIAKLLFIRLFIFKHYSTSQVIWPALRCLSGENKISSHSYSFIPVERFREFSRNVRTVGNCLYSEEEMCLPNSFCIGAIHKYRVFIKSC